MRRTWRSVQFALQWFLMSCSHLKNEDNIGQNDHEKIHVCMRHQTLSTRLHIEHVHAREAEGIY